MYPEYLYNSDTQDIVRRVSELVESDEPALRAHCQEVSRQTDTSSLCLRQDYAARVNVTKASLSIIAKSVQDLSRSLTENAGVFRTRDGKANFPAVCRAVVRVEEERLHLLECITSLTQIRRTVALNVAEINQKLHFMTVAKYAVPEDVRAHYAEAIEHTEAAYARLLALDEAACEAQKTHMIFVEKHLPAFLERLRTAADFNHTGEALDRSAIRALCGELQILLDRAGNVSF